MSANQVSDTEASPVYFLDETVDNVFNTRRILPANRELGRMTVRRYISLNLIYRLWKFKSEAITADRIIYFYLAPNVQYCTSLREITFLQRRILFNLVAYTDTHTFDTISLVQEQLVWKKLAIENWFNDKYTRLPTDEKEHLD